jgi:hypothetical protein
MDQLITTSRSNYFRVRDPDRFKSWANGVGLAVVAEGRGPGFVLPRHTDRIAIFPVEQNGWPVNAAGMRKDSNGGSNGDSNGGSNGHDAFAFVDALAGHLADGEAAVLQTVGAQGIASLVGYSIGVLSDGNSIGCSIDDIYTSMRRLFGIEVSRAEL